MSDKLIINPRRIGDGWGWYIAAIVAFGLALLVSKSAVTDPSAVGVATALWSITGLLFMIGFAIRVVGKIEQRLIDIETKLASSAASVKTLEAV